MALLGRCKTIPPLGGIDSEPTKERIQESSRLLGDQSVRFLIEERGTKRSGG